MSPTIRRRLRHLLIWTSLVAALQIASPPSVAQPATIIWTPCVLAGTSS